MEVVFPPPYPTDATGLAVVGLFGQVVVVEWAFGACVGTKGCPAGVAVVGYQLSRVTEGTNDLRDAFTI